MLRRKVVAGTPGTGIPGSAKAQDTRGRHRMSPTLEKADWRLSRREFRFEFPMMGNEIFIHIQARKYSHPEFFTISPRSVPRLFHSGSGLILLQNYCKEMWENSGFAREVCFILLKAFSLICLTLSRVRFKRLPISSREWGISGSMPKYILRTASSFGRRECKALETSSFN